MKNKHVVRMTKMYGSNRHRGRAGGEGGGLQIMSIASIHFFMHPPYTFPWRRKYKLVTDSTFEELFQVLLERWWPGCNNNPRRKNQDDNHSSTKWVAALPIFNPILTFLPLSWLTKTCWFKIATFPSHFGDFRPQPFWSQKLILWCVKIFSFNKFLLFDIIDLTDL